MKKAKKFLNLNKSIGLVRKTKFSKIQLLLFVLVFASLGGYIIYRSLAASLPNIYIAQSIAGTGDGSNCTNAKAISFFNTASNWGTTTAQIGPGTIVHLCGTITTNITAQASGVSGSPITILFENGAKISMPACPGRGTGCVNLNNKSYLMIDGGTNGIIEDTANGTNLANRSGSYGIQATNCSNCEVKNLTIQNIYVHSGTTAEIDQTAVRAIDFSGSNFLLHDNTIHDAGWAITLGSNGDINDKIYNNNIYNVDHGVTPSFGSSGGSAGPFFIFGNHLHDFNNWDTSSNSYHHDGIHCYSVASGLAQHITDMYIYNNKFDGNIGANSTAWIFLEGAPNGTASDTPCNDASSNIWIFNNILTTADKTSSNDIVTSSNGHLFIANNTIDGFDPADNNRGGCVGWPSGGTFKNNAVGGCNQLINGDSTTSTINHNAYAHCSGSFNCFALGNSSQWTGDFATYRSRFPSFDVNSVANLSSAVASNVAGVGENLTPMCSGNLVSLCSDIDGKPRPTTGAWDAGAQNVPANVWVSTTGNDSTCVRGDQTKACATWGKAWQIACGGDTVEIAAGTYGNQQLATNTTCNKGPTNPVIFKPAVNATVTLDGLLTLGTNNGQATGDPPSGFTLDGANQLTIHGGIYTWYETAYASNITLENFHIWHTEAAYGNGGAGDLFGVGGDNLTIRNVEIGPICCNASGIDIGRPGASTRDAQNIVLNHLNVHDVVNSCNLLPASQQPTCTDTYNSSHHVDGLHIWGANGLQITNNKWLNSSGQVLYLEGVNGGQFNNTLIQNNMIASTGAEPIVIVTSSSTNTYSSAYPLITGYMKILYNTIWGGGGLDFESGSLPGLQWPGPSAVVTIAGNTGVLGQPCSGWSGTVAYESNMWSNARCGGDLPSGTPNFISANAPSFDLHLTSNSTGLNLASPTNCPSTDIDGDVRPQGTACDIGADEYVLAASTKPGDLNNDNKVNILDLSILLSHYGQTATSSQGDITGDNKVSILDLSILLSHYGT